jgi:type IV pilus assembly protein PilO
MAKAPPLNFEASRLLDSAAGQFRNLNANEPGQWPLLPKLAAWLGAALAAVVVGWFLVNRAATLELEEARAAEPRLQADYVSRLRQAVNLSALRTQKQQVQEFVTQLEKQLPGKAEMDALLSDINQAGLGRGLQFDLFRPGQVQVKEYYAELPISIRVSGRYHELGAFAADIANLSRIVTLHNLVIAPVGRDAAGNLYMEATARTYRYLDVTEINEQRAAAAARNKGGGRK